MNARPQSFGPRRAAVAVGMVLVLACHGTAQGQDDPARAAPQPRVLFFTHSAGYVHDVVKRPRPEGLALAERALAAAAGSRFDVVPSQDPADVSGDALLRWDAVVFFTSGELPLSDEDRAGLLDWVAAGGAFVGVHSATDTMYACAPYLEMVGGTFDGHPWHEEVTVRVDDPSHPATAHLGDEFRITDEIYQFRGFRRHPVSVLLGLDGAVPGADGEPLSARGRRDDGDYALAWCRPYGLGRVFYTALGHRPEVWKDARFTDHLLGGIDWALHGPDHPALPGPAPSGAAAPTVLLPRDAAAHGSEGQRAATLAAFVQRDGSEARWDLDAQGVLTVSPGSGDLLTRASFGDALLHVEFRTPERIPGREGQARGNSGVYVHGRYEIQVLDSFGVAPALGECAALYGRIVPARNASRPPGRWQSYDIVFRAPVFDGDEKTRPARMSVWHNGLLVHDDVVVEGVTGGALSQDEVAAGPLLLQDHGDLVSYRNVWIQPLPPGADPP